MAWPDPRRQQAQANTCPVHTQVTTAGAFSFVTTGLSDGEFLYSDSRFSRRKGTFKAHSGRVLDNYPCEYGVLAWPDPGRRAEPFIPILTFVFGEARLNGRCAVVSSYRLDNRFYGLPNNPALMEARLLKEAIHELGHTYGLLHCHNPGCVMKSSTYVEEIDFKSSRFCGTCADKLGGEAGSIRS